MKGLALMAALALHPPGGDDFRCRNEAAEISCAEGKCVVRRDEGFTPMELSRAGSRLTLCAYSGCFTGRIDLIRTRGPVTFLHAPVRRDNGPGSTSGPAETLAVLYDTNARTAQIRFLSYSNAMDCS